MPRSDPAESSVEEVEEKGLVSDVRRLEVDRRLLGDDDVNSVTWRLPPEEEQLSVVENSLVLFQTSLFVRGVLTFAGSHSSAVVDE